MPISRFSARSTRRILPAAITLLLLVGCAAEVSEDMGPSSGVGAVLDAKRAGVMRWEVERQEFSDIPLSDAHCLSAPNDDGGIDKTCTPAWILSASVAEDVLPASDVSVRTERDGDDRTCVTWRDGTRRLCGPDSFVARALRDSNDVRGVEDAVRARAEAWENAAVGACWVHNVSVVAGVTVATHLFAGWLWGHAAWYSTFGKLGLVRKATNVLTYILGEVFATLEGVAIGIAAAFPIWWTAADTFLPNQVEDLLDVLGGQEHYLSWISRKVGATGGEFSIVCGGPGLGDD